MLGMLPNRCKHDTIFVHAMLHAITVVTNVPFYAQRQQTYSRYADADSVKPVLIGVLIDKDDWRTLKSFRDRLLVEEMGSTLPQVHQPTSQGSSWSGVRLYVDTDTEGAATNKSTWCLLRRVAVVWTSSCGTSVGGCTRSGVLHGAKCPLTLTLRKHQADRKRGHTCARSNFWWRKKFVSPVNSPPLR